MRRPPHTACDWPMYSVTSNKLPWKYRAVRRLRWACPWLPRRILHRNQNCDAISGLAFRELEPLARPGLAGLFAFLHARVAREEAFLLEEGAEALVDLKEGAGDAVAERTGRPFVDLDDVVAQAAGVSCDVLLATEGEAAFRRHEARALREVAQLRNHVLATGGGAVLCGDAFDALAPTTTKGELVAHNGTDNVRQAVGTDGFVLTADSAQSTGMTWAAAAVTPAAGSVYSDGSTLKSFNQTTAASVALAGINTTGVNFTIAVADTVTLTADAFWAVIEALTVDGFLTITSGTVRVI